MSRRPALSGAPGADSKSLILRNRACLSSVSLLESAYRGGATKTPATAKFVLNQVRKMQLAIHVFEGWCH